jgi:hypothetical protein
MPVASEGMMGEGGRKRAAVVLAALLVAGAAAADKVYRWVDRQGQVHYSDQPAPNAQEVEINAVAPAAAIASDEAAARRAAECQRKREVLVRYQNAAAITETDALGNTRQYSSEEKQKLIERTQAWLDQNCGGAQAPSGE